MSEPRACPGCDGALQLVSASGFCTARCDAAGHVGERGIGYGDSFACVNGCGLDYCSLCYEAMPASACAQQVNVRLRPGFELLGDETAGAGYCCRTNKFRTVVSPAVRDNSHRECVPRAKHDELMAELRAAKAACRARPPASAPFSPVSPCQPCGQPATPPTAVRPTEVQELNGEADAQRYAAGVERRIRSDAAKVLRLQNVIDYLSLQQQGAAQALREAERDRNAAIRAEQVAVGAQARATQAQRHKANAYERLKAKAESKVADADAARADAEKAEAEAKAASSEAAAEAAAADARAAWAESTRQTEVAAMAEVEASLKVQLQAAQQAAAIEAERAAGNEEAVQRLSSAFEETTAELEKLQRRVRGGRGVGVGLETQAAKVGSVEEYFMRELNLDYKSLPPKEINCISSWERNVKFLSAAMDGRDPKAIGAAIGRNEKIRSVLDSYLFQREVKVVVHDVLQVIQEHWSARHAVILMSEVHLSLSEMDALRHLLSFIYDHDKDLYERIIVWTNATDETDTLTAPTLASRYAWEKERAMVYGKCGVESSADGLFSGVSDLEGSLVGLVEHYWDALDAAVQQQEKELMFVLTGDATGGWRGDSITHGEIGIGSFEKGKALSKLAALPVWLQEGEDSAENLRSRAGRVFEQYNKLKRKGEITVTIKGVAITLRIKVLTSADFQFFKAINNMSKYTSAVWCTCLLDNMYKYPDWEATTWDDCLSFYHSIGCELKTLKTICELNHWSVDVLEGRRFKPFGCRCGYKSGSEKEWRAAVEAHAQLDEKEKKEVDLEHSSNPLHYRHKPLDAPLVHQGMIDNSTDVLHLIFSNQFAFFMEHTMLTILMEWEPAARAPFEAYLRSIGIPMKIVKATSVTEMKQSMTGRDAKVLTAKALKHIPTLLEFVHMNKEEIAAAVEEVVLEAEEEAEKEAEEPPAKRRRAADDDDDVDWDGEDDDEEDGEEEQGEEEEGEGEREEDQQDDDCLTRFERDARSWDIFFRLVRAMRPFERDDPEYRRARAVETFNAAGGVMKEWKRLNPSAQSACPHVALVVLPRQQVEHGDHTRRGADHGEAYGASIKDGIHRRCLRRKIGLSATEHTRVMPDGSKKTWMQGPLKVSRVMQAFRSMCVTERLLRDEGSLRYLQRKHYKLKSTGFTTAAEAAGKQHVEAAVEASIYGEVSRKVQEAREHA